MATPISPVSANASTAKSATAVKGVQASGLSNDEARRRLQKVGPNAMPDTALHPLRRALEKFWAPVPWMLEAAIVLELVLGKYVEAAIIAALLVFNAALGLFQESRAQATLAALKSRLALNASVRRDGAWKTVPAAELVPGDLVKLSLGGVVAADVKLTGGEVLLDQSMLTGESFPIEAGPGIQTFAGALVRRGEAVAEVTATGTRTKFGRTAELVRTAHVVSSQQKAVLRVVRNLAAFNGVVIVLLLAYAYFLKMPFAEIVPLVLTAILASIPVALPATFSLAAALGARALAKLGVLPTRLSAVDEAGTTDVLCADKTGTLTQNSLTVTTVRPMPGFDEAHVLALAALASSDGGQDPVDGAIRAAAARKTVSDAPKLVKFIPFDPAKKMSEASATDSIGATQRIVKGAFAAIIGLAQKSPTASTAAKELEGQGFRVMAVAAGPPTALKLAGLIALSDPPRADSTELVTELHGLGVRTVMVTGDAPATAAIVARAVGLDGAVCPPGPIPDSVHPEQFAVYAGVLPEDKYKLVKAFQKGGHTVGMCGDGANDAPALRQAQIGIAVSTATDVAKSAAGMVLTNAGLAGIVAAVKEGRITFQRIQTYTLNAIIKKIVTVLFLIVGLIMTGAAILTPLLMVIVMVTGDFLSMSLTTDKVRPSPTPNAWRIGNLTKAGITMGMCLLAFCTGVLAVGKFGMNLRIEALRTLAFVVLVFGSQATIYAIRERRHLWCSRPSLLLAVSSVADIAIASTLAVGGIAMTPIPALLVGGTLAAAVIFAVLSDLVKVPIFVRLGIAQSPRHRPVNQVTPDSAKKIRIPITEPSAGQPAGASDLQSDVKAEPKPEAIAELNSTVKAGPTHEAKAKPPTDLTPRIAKRAYELYEEGGRKEGAAVQNWEKAELEIRNAQVKAEPPRETKAETKPVVKVESTPAANDQLQPVTKTDAQPETRAAPNAETLTASQPETRAEAETGVSPQLVQRVHKLYEKLGRQDIRAVQDWEKAQEETRKERSAK
jgi:H+-transporting ATPase